MSTPEDKDDFSASLRWLKHLHARGVIYICYTISIELALWTQNTPVLRQMSSHRQHPKEFCDR